MDILEHVLLWVDFLPSSGVGEGGVMDILGGDFLPSSGVGERGVMNILRGYFLPSSGVGEEMVILGVLPSDWVRGWEVMVILGDGVGDFLPSDWEGEGWDAGMMLLLEDLPPSALRIGKLLSKAGTKVGASGFSWLWLSLDNAVAITNTFPPILDLEYVNCVLVVKGPPTEQESR